jgi:hypothetical protein
MRMTLKMCWIKRKYRWAIKGFLELFSLTVRDRLGRKVVLGEGGRQIWFIRLPPWHRLYLKHAMISSHNDYRPDPGFLCSFPVSSHFPLWFAHTALSFVPASRSPKPEVPRLVNHVKTSENWPITTTPTPDNISLYNKVKLQQHQRRSSKTTASLSLSAPILFIIFLLIRNRAPPHI